MNRKELVKAIQEEGDYTIKEIDTLLGAILDQIIKGTNDTGQVKLVGFGTFEKGVRKGRKGRNPATGEIIDIPTKNIVKFNVGQSFKNIIEG